MRSLISRTETFAHDLDTSLEKRAETAPRRGRIIRLDRHIRQAEWAERLKGHR